MDGIFYFDFEAKIMVFLQSFMKGTAVQEVLIVLNNFFSFFGEEMIAVMILGFFYWGIDKKKGFQIANAVLMVDIGNSMIKNVFNRLRPYLCLEEVELLRDVEGYSFPSGHSASSATVYPTLAYMHPKNKLLKVIAIVLPLLVGISRCYLGAHWPTDVLVGWAFGLAVTTVYYFKVNKIKNQNLVFLIEAVVMGIGCFYCKTTDYYSTYGMFIGVFIGKLLEEKWFHFENTKSIPIAILRTAVCGGLFFGLNEVIKMIFGANIVSLSTADFAFRVARYAIISAFLIGIFPLCFAPVEKFFSKKK